MNELVGCLLACLLGLSRGLQLVQNGYEGLTVAIGESLPQEHCNAIVHGLQVTHRERLEGGVG